MGDEKKSDVIVEAASAQVVKIEAPDKLNIPLVEFKCGGCRRVLALYAIIDGCMVVKCKRCKAWNCIDIHSEVQDNGGVKVG
ncbi:MAG: hypothetical protein PHO67_08055 [Candidatus Omnitrophica bacterium]|nr:hypothetical protein [Candidatus Omnitrophota bacterium]